MLSQLLSLAAGPSRAPLRGPCRLAAHFHSSHPLDAVRKRTTAHRIMQGLRGRWDEDRTCVEGGMLMMTFVFFSSLSFFGTCHVNAL